MSTRNELQALQDTPLVLNPAEEPLNSMSIENSSNVNSPTDGSKSISHWGSGYNSRKRASISGHSVFVLSIEGQPLTPCKPSKARKLLKGNQAKPVWNKFGMFGIQMIQLVGKKYPLTTYGYDIGTKFEGHSIVCGRENILSFMWILPNKKSIVKKQKERCQLRRLRRYRNCRRREERNLNRNKKGFISPSQSVIIYSRFKALKEIFKYYPIDISSVEDVHFNHRDYKWGKNFSTMEIGKNKIFNFISSNSKLIKYNGIDTELIRKKYGYKKCKRKDSYRFESHCSDSLSIAIESGLQSFVIPENFIVIDDSYRPVKRKLHFTQPTKGCIRKKYSSGNIFGIRKGSICKFGQICGGIKKEKLLRMYNNDNKRIEKTIKKIIWTSHKFKAIKGGSLC